MSMEEHFLDTLDDDEDEEWGLSTASSWRERRHQRLQRKNRASIDEFVGSGGGTNAAAILPRYYDELLTWTLDCQKGKVLPRQED